ncbi:MAG TPA: efflux RND transporter periplasmic adaptor subunit [Gemmatimonadaceae bacterium]|nr:efflux RND transporter periplasmic adaptor subunit [Gemmatimonadaceae bacterium]
MKRAFVRPSVYAVVLLATIGGVYLVTRDGSAAPPPASHNHGAVAAGDTTGKLVTLSDADARRIGVTFATVTRGSLSREVRTVGQITFDETRVQAIAPKVDGWVERLLVNSTGQPVAAGEPLLTIYSPMLVTAQEELLLARRLESDVAGAESDARRRAAELVASARRRLAYWDISAREIAEIERTGVVRKTLALRSPASGYVLEKSVLPGQRIMAGDALYKVADLGTVWVEGEVFEQDLASMRVGQDIRAEFQALPGEHRIGRISFIHPTLDPETHTVRVRVALANRDLRLKPGMYATIRVAVAARRAAMTVPRSAVLSTGNRSIVFTRDGQGRLAPREVALGASSDDRIEILRGVTEGDTVVASATFLVDAESNLGTALGGMGDMPGMELTAPPKPLDSTHQH